MTINYKFIKRLLLLSTLNVCWQISPLAMEKEKDAMDVEVTEGGYKRSATHAGLYNDPIVYSLQDFPIELNKYLVTYFDLRRDQNTLFCLMESCAAFHYVVMDKYKEANKVEHHYPWQDSPSLYPSTVYILNSRMGTILGLYANIRFYENMANRLDKSRFKRLCSQFLKKSLLPEDSVPYMYVDFLQFDVSGGPSTLSNDEYEESLKEKKQSCIDKLTGMVDPKNSDLQNEHALYFHYCHFSSGMQPAELVALKDTDCFRSLNGSLMRGMNTGLLTLKGTPGLDSSGNFAETWKRIIELEPAVTIRQLKKAGRAYYNVGDRPVDAAAKAASYTKAAEYYEERLEAIIATGENPTADDYTNIAHAYFRVGEHAADPATKAVNYTKAAEYCEEAIKAIKARGENPSVIVYSNAANAYFGIGEYAAADPATKAVNYTKAAEYREEAIKAIIATGKIPHVIVYSNIANTYFQVGNYAPDPETKAANYTKAAEYYEEAIKAIKATGENPPGVAYSNAAHGYFQAGNYAADPAAKAANYTKAAEYCEEQLKAIKATGKNPPAIVYNTAAHAYFGVGEYAADLATKAANYTKSAEYFVVSLSKGLNDDLAEKARNTLEKISAYLDNSNNEVYDLNIEAQGTTGVGG